MTWLRKFLGRLPGRNRRDSDSLLVPLPTGDATIVANVMVRAKTQQDIHELLAGFETLQAHPGLPPDALHIASIVEETYPLIKKAQNIKPMSEEWLNNITNILQTINDNAEKYVEAQDRLTETLSHIERESKKST